MGNKKLHTKADEPEKASYSVIRYPAAEVPITYRNMLLSKYLRSLQGGNDYHKLTLPKAFFAEHEPYFQRLLERPQAKLRMAVLSDNHDTVLGWSLMEPHILHYVWVGGEYRRSGLASELIPDSFNTTTHITKFWLPIWNAKYQDVDFNPYLIR